MLPGLVLGRLHEERRSACNIFDRPIAASDADVSIGTLASPPTLGLSAALSDAHSPGRFRAFQPALTAKIQVVGFFGEGPMTSLLFTIEVSATYRGVQEV